VAQDYAQAATWYRLAANGGDISAQFNLGVLYANGSGVAQDMSEAAKWYDLAATQGDDGAQNNLGALYANGSGVPKDNLEAYKWFALSAVHGNAMAAKNRDIIAKRLTADQLAQAKKLVQNWTPRLGLPIPPAGKT
jgi:TPR repeat protein